MNFFRRGNATASLTIYEKLLAEGYTDEHIRAYRDHSAREFTVAVSDTPDGPPLVGIAYMCDFRAEEERGVGELKKAFGAVGHSPVMTKAGKTRTGQFIDTPGDGGASLILSTREIGEVHRWGYDILENDGYGYSVARGSRDRVNQSNYGSGEYDTDYSYFLPSAQGITRTSLHFQTIPELRKLAATLGITGPFPRKKAGLIDYILSQPEYADTATTPDVWPGWFHNGKVLVLRADRGIAASVLNHLAEAVDRGTLAFGNGAVVFGSGIALYDGADVGPKLKKQRKDEADWYDAQMKALEPVEKELKAKGHKWFFLGNPQEKYERDEAGNPVGSKVTMYWLNGMGNPQPYGWYTLVELRAEKFVKDFQK